MSPPNFNVSRYRWLHGKWTKKVSVSVWDFTVWISSFLFPTLTRLKAMQCRSPLSFVLPWKPLSEFHSLSLCCCIFHSQRWQLSLLCLFQQCLNVPKENQLSPPLVFLVLALSPLDFGPVSRIIMGAFELPVQHLKWLFNACLLWQVKILSFFL